MGGASSEVDAGDHGRAGRGRRTSTRSRWPARRVGTSCPPRRAAVRARRRLRPRRRGRRAAPSGCWSSSAAAPPAAVTDVDERAPRATDPDAPRPAGPGRRRAPTPATEIGETLDGDRLPGRARTATTLVVQPPSWRPDLTVGVDLVEEVARLAGLRRDPVGAAGRAGRPRPHPRPAAAPLGGPRRWPSTACVEVLSYPFVAPTVHDAFGLPADDPRRRRAAAGEPAVATSSR